MEYGTKTFTVELSCALGQQFPQPDQQIYDLESNIKAQADRKSLPTPHPVFVDKGQELTYYLATVGIDKNMCADCPNQLVACMLE